MDSSCSSRTSVIGSPSGYISATEGANTKSAPIDSASFASASRRFGYLSKSSFLPNWMGFKNTLTTVTSHSLTDALIKAPCPSWSAPIVGTRPILLPLFARGASVSRRESIDLIICMINYLLEQSMLFGLGKTQSHRAPTANGFHYGQNQYYPCWWWAPGHRDNAKSGDRNVPANRSSSYRQ